MHGSLPDKYALPGVPFTPAGRPRMEYGAAKHMLDDHAYDAPKVNGKDRFPSKTFGIYDDDVELARIMVDDLTYRVEPRWADSARTALYFEGNLGGVQTRVPVRLNRETGKWETRTGHPIGKDYGKGGEYDGQIHG